MKNQTTNPRQSAYDLVQQQAEDEGLWFVARYTSEAYLQQALRTLHAAVECDAIEREDPPQ